MPVLPFPSVAAPLSPAGLQAAVTALGVDEPTLWAMLKVETGSCGFLASRRPQILFERHIFSRLTQHAWDAPPNDDISNPVPGGYGGRGDHQYARIGKAYALDADAALQSASWGMGQIMGENFKSVGFASVEEMVAAMAAGEDAQLAAVVAFVIANNLQVALQNQDWATYARHYNGPTYAQNEYDTKLAAAYTLYQDPTQQPDLVVRTAQMLLTMLGFNPLGIDGRPGAHTLTALHNFQVQQGQPLTPGIDANAVAALQAAMPPAPNLNLA